MIFMKFKLLFLNLITVLIFNHLIGQEIPKSSEQILDLAFQQAKIENKNVFIMFKASWCGWCKKMESTMNEETIGKYFTDNYVIQHLVVLESSKNKNLENFGAESLLNKYGGENQGIPFFLIFDSDSNLLADSKMIKGEEILKSEGENIGCPGTDEEIDAFIYKLQKTSNLNADELLEIVKQFKLISN